MEYGILCLDKHLIIVGLSPLILQTEYPCDVFTGYIFGGVWLFLNIILLEVYRILPGLQFTVNRPKNNNT